VLENMLALGRKDGRVLLVDAATGEEKWAVQAYTGKYSIPHVAMSPDGRFVASVGLDEESWKIWDAASGAVRRVGASHDGNGACICELQKGRRLFQKLCPVVAHTGDLLAVAFSPCGYTLVTGDENGAVIVWKGDKMEAENFMQTDSGSECLCLSFSADGARLASGDQDIYLWDATTWLLLLRMHGENLGAVESLHFSPINKNLLARTGKNGLTLWDVEKGESMKRLEGHRFAVFSPDGRTIATFNGWGARDVHLVDVETGALRLRIAGEHLNPQGNSLPSPAWSIDGSKLATGNRDASCKVWDSSTGALIRSIRLGKALVSVSWGCDWVRDTQRAMAFAMGHHPRLGAGSRVLELEVGVVRMILDRV
jgi:WD40 repeat protein